LKFLLSIFALPQEFVWNRWLANLNDGEEKYANTIDFKIVYVCFLCIFVVTFSELLSFYITFMIERLFNVVIVIL
jgi:hypothetical protein